MLRIKKTVWGDYVIEKDIEFEGVPKIEEISSLSDRDLYELREEINKLIDSEGNKI